MTNQLSRSVREQHSGRRRSKRKVDTGARVPQTELTLSLEEAYLGATRFIRLNGRRIKVALAPGIVDCQIMRINGKGGRGPNHGISLALKVSPHRKFQRNGNNLRRDLSIESEMAVFGGTVWMKTLRGKVKITIPKRTTAGKKIRLRGFGMPVYGKKNKFGDLVVNITVKPARLKQEQIDLFGTLAP